MALPARAKKQAEVVTALSVSATAAEATQAGVALQNVANDNEVTLDDRARSTLLAADLLSPPTAAEMSRREQRLSAAISWCGMRI